MGKRWFYAVRRAFGSVFKENNKEEKSMKKLGLEETKELVQSISRREDDLISAAPVLGTPALPLPPPTPAKQSIEAVANGRGKHAYSVAIATAVAAEAAAVAACAAAEVVRLTTSCRSIGEISREEIPAVKIQTAYRCYLARRALQSFRGEARLKSMTDSSMVKHQTVNTLHCMQTLTRVQSQVRARKIRSTEENQALYRQSQIKHEKELEKLELGEDWNDNPQSKEQHEAKLQKRQEAALRRERTLAYSYSHQRHSNPSRPKKPSLVEPTNPDWDWSWLERRTETRPWETNRSPGDGDRRSDCSSVKSDVRRSFSGDLFIAPSRPPSLQSPSTPLKAKEDDLQSLLSFRSERHRQRHSVGGESLVGLPPVPGYMSPTQSTRAKSRFLTPPAVAGAPARRAAVGSARKQLSFPPAGERKSVKSLSPSTSAGGFIGLPI